ncbi:MAG TPA: serine hydrolase domain-containing protein [Thermoanaerobaculia bacterium]|jgi:CubicO group peptidase (beta-lactamase class C family)
MRRLAAALLLLSSMTADAAALTERQLQAMLERARVKAGLPGLAVAVVTKNHSVTAVAGFRQFGGKEKIALTDRFHIASCTKSMTAMLGAIAVERGELQWSSKFVDVVPELATVIRPEYRTATLEQLLAHRAHFPAYTQFGPERLEQLKRLTGTPTEQRLRFLREVLSSEPPNEGTGDAAYSNAGYTAAAAMLERASKTPWETLIIARVTEPLRMRSVHFGWPATAADPHQPRGHFLRDGKIEMQPLDDSYSLPVALWPAGAVNSTIGDLARYIADQLNGLRGRKALLPQRAYERLHSAPDGSESGFTIGWGIRRDPQRGLVHYGAGSGGTFFVRMLIVPGDDIALVAASNSGDAAPATRQLFDDLLEKLAPHPH